MILNDIFIWVGVTLGCVYGFVLLVMSTVDDIVADEDNIDWLDSFLVSLSRIAVILLLTLMGGVTGEAIYCVSHWMFSVIKVIVNYLGLNP